MAKIGRNELCPCGSGKKYKRCHGFAGDQTDLRHDMRKVVDRKKAQEVQRKRQQGHGKPIISEKFNGRRLVAVKNRLLHSKKWLTFHDFLMDYIKMAMGPDWGTGEIAKPLEQRHPILVWYELLCKHQQQSITKPGEVHEAAMTGAVAAYMHLAYDLYALDHNAELQEKLIGRLRDHDNFYGARYEVFVAAVLIRAGFEIEFEDEDDRSSSHCEFTVTYSITGKRFSVEAKHRAGNKFRLGRQLNRALAKKANYKRIVFIDINVPDAADVDVPTELVSALGSLRAFEGRIINGNPLPDAYLFVTNNPWHHHLEEEAFRSTVMAEGFQIQDFKSDWVFYGLREAIEAREHHIEMYDLLSSMKDHSDIPSTFDGEIPEFAFGETPARLLIGESYLIENEDGIERPGVLTTATVMESENKVYGGLLFEDGTAGIYTWPLSDAEMIAWRRHPDTFFGELRQRKTNADTPLDLYDFFLESYKNTTKERLLEFMSQAKDIDDLRKLDQASLASIYCERCVNAAWVSQKPSKTNNLL